MERRDFLKLTGLLSTLVVLDPTKASALVGETIKTPYDVEVWGQKALDPRSTALDRINVRTTINEIQKVIERLVRSYTWKRMNDSHTRNIVTTKISEYLSNVRARNGIRDYKVICDLTNNTDQDVIEGLFNVDIFLQPTASIEFIELKVIAGNMT